MTAHETSTSTDSVEALVVEPARWEKRTGDAKKRSSLLCATSDAWVCGVDMPNGRALWGFQPSNRSIENLVPEESPSGDCVLPSRVLSEAPCSLDWRTHRFVGDVAHGMRR